MLRDSYCLGEVLDLDETRTLEFKEVSGHNHVRTIVDTAPAYAVAFLNSDGGKILWGVNDERREVVGIPLSLSQRDELSQKLSKKLGTIRPEFDPTAHRLRFIPVATNSGGSERYVVELTIPRGRTDQTYCIDGHFYVRLDGINEKLQGLRLADWIRGRQVSPSTLGPVTDPAATQLAKRLRQTFSAHGLEPAHIPRFLEQRRAPFALGLPDLQSDAALLRWISDERLDWIASTFRVRREWLDGEDNEIHDRLHFDKQPAEFFSFVKDLLKDPQAIESHSDRCAYFIRTAKGRRWLSGARDDVVVVLATPIAYLNSEKVIVRYVSDLTPYPWDYGRTHIQLRAWARLLFVELGFMCLGMRADEETIEQLQGNDAFLASVVHSEKVQRAHDWCPEDYGLHRGESVVAKETETMSEVAAFLREHGLPCESATGRANAAT